MYSIALYALFVKSMWEKDAKEIILCYFINNASVVEWSITTDCKSVALGLRRFESFPAHKICSSQKSMLLLNKAQMFFGAFFNENYLWKLETSQLLPMWITARQP